MHGSHHLSTSYVWLLSLLKILPLRSNTYPLAPSPLLALLMGRAAAEKEGPKSWRGRAVRIVPSHKAPLLKLCENILFSKLCRYHQVHLWQRKNYNLDVPNLRQRGICREFSKQGSPAPTPWQWLRRWFRTAVEAFARADYSM